MKKTNTFSAAVFLVFVAASFFGARLGAEASLQSFSSFLSPDERRALIEKGELTNSGSVPSDLSLWKRAPFSGDVAGAIGSISASVAAEGLFLIDRPADPSAPQYGNGSADTDIERKILKSFTSFSTMKGLLAYSESKKKMKTFICESYRIASLQDRSALPDPDVSEVPQRSSWTVYLKEDQAGVLYSGLTVSFLEGRAYITLTNLTDIKVLGFHVVRPGEMRTVFVIVPLDDKIAFYGLTVANTPRFFGLERVNEKPILNRMKALVSWFEGNMAKS